MTTHSGTHLDAPYHFASTMNHGERAITIDEVPLEWRLPMAGEAGLPASGRRVRGAPDDVDAELRRIGHALSPLEIVVVNTAADHRDGHDDDAGMGRRPPCTCSNRVSGSPEPTPDAPFSYRAVVRALPRRLDHLGGAHGRS